MQTVITKYLPATAHRGSRIKVSSWLGNKIIPWDYALDAEDNHKVAFYAWLDEENKEMYARFGVEPWFKYVAHGNLPDSSGYAFIIK